MGTIDSHVFDTMYYDHMYWLTNRAKTVSIPRAPGSSLVFSAFLFLPMKEMYQRAFLSSEQCAMWRKMGGRRRKRLR